MVEEIRPVGLDNRNVQNFAPALNAVRESKLLEGFYAKLTFMAGLSHPHYTATHRIAA